jgi:phosphomannomutase
VHSGVWVQRTTTRIDNLRTYPYLGSLENVSAHGVTFGVDTLASSARTILILPGEEKATAYRRVSSVNQYDPSCLLQSAMSAGPQRCILIEAQQVDRTRVNAERLMKPYRVAMFDLDGTLAASKSEISPAMVHMLRALLSAIDVCIISGGRFEQFDAQVLRQLGEFCDLKRLHLMPTCGTRYLRWEGGAWDEVYFEKLSSDEKNRAFEVLRSGAEKLGFWTNDTWGPALEDRGSQVTYSALGQSAPVDVKSAWDPDNSKKESLRKFAAERLPDLEVKSGGSTSIDVTRRGIDKAYGARKLMLALRLTEREILFFGDRLDPGGNDYPIKAMGIDCIEVHGWSDTISKVTKAFGDLLS